MIGILAGMGPKSTAPFIEKVVDLCQQRHGAKCDMDFPPMMIYSCPTPFYLDRPLDHGAMRAAITAGAVKLAACGAEYIAIPCNVAHVYYEFLQQAVSIPMLNMIEETVKSIPGEAKTVTVLATPSTLEAQIYQRSLARSDKEFIFKPHWQETVNRILELIKGGNDRSEAQDRWQELAQDIRRFAAVGIIACTDLNVLTDQACSQLAIVDSSTCLARAVADTYYLKYRKQAAFPNRRF